MKKRLLMMALFASLAVSAQEGCRFGLNSMLNVGRTDFSGGDKIASAHFRNDNFGGLGLGLNWRRDYTQRWMVTAGFGIRMWGFQYSLTNDYSLVRYRNKDHNVIFNDFVSAEIPVTLFYKGRLNCRGIRFIAGAGFAVSLTGRQVQRGTAEMSEEPGAPSIMTSKSVARPGASFALRGVVGTERVMQNGRIVQLNLVFSRGLGRSATSSVQYTADGKEFYHEFTTNGSYVGLQSVIFFKSRAERFRKNQNKD
jgi:hypothetical protein